MKENKTVMHLNKEEDLEGELRSIGQLLSNETTFRKDVGEIFFSSSIERGKNR